MGENFRGNREKRAAGREDFPAGQPEAPGSGWGGLPGLSFVCQRIYGAFSDRTGALRSYCLCVLPEFSCLCSPYAPWFLYPIYKKKDLKKKRLRQLTLQFKEAIQVLSSFLSAGYSLENSLFMSVRELEALYGKDAMITEEFERLAAGVRMNRPVEQLLAEFGERSGIQDVDHFAQVFGMARRSGGELVEIIRQSAGVIRDKIQVQEEIQTMTAARIFEQKIMNGIPFGMILYIDFTSPGFFDIMYGTWMGRLIMTLCLAFYMGAVMLSGKILDIEI